VPDLSAHLSRSPETTLAAAAALAEQLRPGDCVALEGELGAGKTQFVRGLVQGLGGDGSVVCSPTFILMNVYDTPRMKVFHVDAYRVRDGAELAAIGLDELLGQDGLLVIEWPSRAASILPIRRWNVTLAHAGPTARRITIDPPS
jgi:tRNA threonylcarbamoyladenosine biosynthesis protein TsaE